jgi:hypothetical protein
LSFAKRRVGIRIAAKIIRPPIVGVPLLASSPFSPRVLIVSAACISRNFSISVLPKTKEIISERITAIDALNEMY